MSKILALIFILSFSSSYASRKKASIFKCVSRLHEVSGYFTVGGFNDYININFKFGKQIHYIDNNKVFLGYGKRDLFLFSEKEPLAVVNFLYYGEAHSEEIRKIKISNYKNGSKYLLEFFLEDKTIKIKVILKANKEESIIRLVSIQSNIDLKFKGDVSFFR